MLNEENKIVSQNLVAKVYDIRDIISKNLYVVYETENLDEEHAGYHFSVDDSVIQMVHRLGFLELLIIQIIKNFD